MSPRGRTKRPESDRDLHRIKVALEPDEFDRVSTLADAEFATLAETAADLLRAGLAIRDQGAATPKSGLASVRERKMAAEAELKEIEAAKRRREVVTIEQVLDFYKTEIGTIKSRLNAIPSAMTTLAPEQLAELKVQLDDAFSDIAGHEPATWIEADGH